MFNYSDRPAKVEARHVIGGERPAKVFEIGRHKVTVYDDGEVTYITQLYGTDPRSAMPNIEIIDGQIRIEVGDLIEDMLARIEPEELAVALLANEDVKTRLIDGLSERYTADNINDKDRRAFIEKVKEQIHSEALDRTASAMAKMEYTLSTGWSCWKVIREANQYLEAIDCRKADGALYRIDDPTRSGQFSIGGATWNEARDHWRHEMRAQLGFKEQNHGH